MTNTERITLHVCNKHSVGVPYPFTTLDTETELTMRDWIITAALCLVAFIVGACMVRGAMEFAQDIWRAL